MFNLRSSISCLLFFYTDDHTVNLVCQTQIKELVFIIIVFLGNSYKTDLKIPWKILQSGLFLFRYIKEILSLLIYGLILSVR